MKAQLPKFVKYDPAHVRALRQFVSVKQLRLITDLTYEEEGEHFVAKLKEYAERVATMPKTYEQDGKGDEAIVYLHYFVGSCDWWITERDQETEQAQAFGLADWGYGGELGYISIQEVCAAGAELDLYCTPKPLKEVRQ